MEVEEIEKNDGKRIKKIKLMRYTALACGCYAVVSNLLGMLVLKLTASAGLWLENMVSPPWQGFLCGIVLLLAAEGIRRGQPIAGAAAATACLAGAAVSLSVPFLVFFYQVIPPVAVAAVVFATLFYGGPFVILCLTLPALIAWKKQRSREEEPMEGAEGVGKSVPVKGGWAVYALTVILVAAGTAGSVSSAVRYFAPLDLSGWERTELRDYGISVLMPQGENKEFDEDGAYVLASTNTNLFVILGRYENMEKEENENSSVIWGPVEGRFEGLKYEDEIVRTTSEGFPAYVVSRSFYADDAVYQVSITFPGRMPPRMLKEAKKVFESVEINFRKKKAKNHKVHPPVISPMAQA